MVDDPEDKGSIRMFRADLQEVYDEGEPKRMSLTQVCTDIIFAVLS